MKYIGECVVVVLGTGRGREMLKRYLNGFHAPTRLTQRSVSSHFRDSISDCNNRVGSWKCL